MSDTDKKWLTSWQAEHGRDSTTDNIGKIVLDDDVFEDIMDTLEDLANRQVSVKSVYLIIKANYLL
jgi:hypothetical protein